MNSILLRYVLSVTLCGAVVMKGVEQKTLVKRRWSYKVRSSAEPWQTLFLFLWPEQDSVRNKQNKQDEWMIQGLAYHLQNDGRLQKFADH